MPFPDRLARFNRLVTNPLAQTIAGRLPPFALVLHRGRRTGKAYRTPVWAFPTPDGGFAIALTYGPDRDWVRNVLAQGGCALDRGGRRVPLAAPRILAGVQGSRLMPRLLRPVLRLLGVTDVLQLSPSA